MTGESDHVKKGESFDPMVLSGKKYVLIYGHAQPIVLLCGTELEKFQTHEILTITIVSAL